MGHKSYSSELGSPLLVTGQLWEQDISFLIIPLTPSSDGLWLCECSMSAVGWGAGREKERVSFSRDAHCGFVEMIILSVYNL